MAYSKKAFTIIELLVVIVIIGILASIVIVSFSNVSSRGIVASLQSDLTSAKRQLINFQTQSSTSSFPTAINCSSPSASEICIKPSGSNTFSYNVNNSSNPATFNLTATNGTTKYWINDSSNVLTTPDIVTSGLVLNLDAGNPASYSGTGTTWNDLSGNGFNASMTNSSYISANSGSIVFNGSSTYASITSPIGGGLDFGTGDFTLRSVFRLNNNASSWTSIFQKGTSGSVGYGMHIFNNTLVASIQSGANNQHSNFNTLNVGNYYDCSLVFKRDTNISAYCNGNSVGTATYMVGNDGSITNSSNIVIGSWQSLTTWWFPGFMYIIQVYNRALSAPEVTQNFNAIKTRYGL